MKNMKAKQFDSNKTKMKNKTRPESAILNHLDNLKIIMLMNIKEFSNIYEKIYYKYNFDFESIEINKLNQILGEQYHVFKYLIFLLQFQEVNKFDGRIKVNILEFLTATILLMHGEWRDRAIELFRIHNINRDLIDEKGLFQMIRRVVICLKKIKLLENLELLEDEAKFMAMMARVIQEDGIKTFQAGLTLDWFVTWTESNPICQIIFRFINVFYRLINGLYTFKQRSLTLYDIVQNSISNRNDPIEYHNKLPDEICQKIFLKNKDSNSMNFLTTFSNLSFKNKSFQIKISKLIPVETPLYSISRPIIERNLGLYQKTLEPDLKCCSKYYEQAKIISYQVPMYTSNNLIPILINNLESSSKYNISIFNDHIKFPEMSIETSSTNDHKSFLFISSSLSLQQSQLIIQDLDNIKDLDIIFSGNILNVDPLIEKFSGALKYYYSDNSMDNYQFNEFCEDFFGHLRQYYRSQLFNMSRDLFSTIVSYLPDNSDIQYSKQSASKFVSQIHLFHSVYPCSKKSLFSLSPFLGRHFLEFVGLLEEENDLQFQSISKVSTKIIHNRTTLYFVSPLKSKSFGAFTLIDLLFVLNGFISNHSVLKEHERSIIIVIRDPRSLFEGNNNNNNSFRPKEFSKETEASKDLKLFGRYELVHGEYNSTKTPSMNNIRSSKFSLPGLDIFDLLKDENNNNELKNFDRGFSKLIKLAFSYLANIAISSDGSLLNFEFTIISTDWMQGKNFIIKRKYDKYNLQLTHLNLLPTFEKSEVLSTETRFYLQNFNNTIFSTIQNSLPSDLELEYLSNTDERHLIFPSNFPLSPFENYKIPRELKVNLIEETKINITNRIQLIRGLRMIDLQPNSVIVEIEIQGIGEISASLYELPMHVHRDEFYRMKKSHRQQFSPKDSKKCYQLFGYKRTVQFRFSKLLSFSNYGIILEIDSESILRDCIVFKTKSHFLPGYISFLLTPKAANLDIYQSIRNDVLNSFLTIDRFYVNTVINLPSTQRGTLSKIQNDYYENTLFDLNKSFHLFDLKNISFLDSIHLDKISEPIDSDYFFPDSFKKNIITINQPAIGGIKTIVQGIYCIIIPQYSNDFSVNAMHDFLLSQSFNELVDIEIIIIITGKFLIPLFQLRSATTSSYKYFPSQNSSLQLYEKLFHLLLSWKSQKENRDCKIIGSSQNPKVITFLIASIDKFENNDQKAEDESSFKDAIVWSRAEGIKNYLPDSIASSELPYIQYIVFPETSHSKLSNEEPGSLFFEESNEFGSNINSLPNSPLEMSKEHLFLETESIDNLKFPETVSILFEKVIFEFLPFEKVNSFGISYYPAHDDLYFESRKVQEIIPPSYLIKIFERDQFNIPLLDLNTDFTASLASDNSIAMTLSSKRTQSGNWIFVQEVFNKFDLFKIIFGPVIGKVTQDEARIMFEFNIDLPKLICILRPISTEGSFEAKSEVEHVKAFTPIIFHFLNLQAGQKYEILLPSIYKYRILGTFETNPEYSTYVDLIFTASNGFQFLPIVDEIVEQILNHQLPELDYIDLLNNYIHNNRSKKILERGEFPSLWHLLEDFYVSPESGSTKNIFHAASFSIIPIIWKFIYKKCFYLLKDVHLDVLRDDDIVSHYYLTQIEEVIKDVFRSLWSMPCIANLFSTSGNIFINHSQYLLPIKDLSEYSDTDNKKSSIIRTIFQEQIVQYYHNLYNDRLDEYLRYWKVGSLLIVLVDIVNGRVKIPKKDDTIFEEEEEPEEGDENEADEENDIGEKVDSDREISKNINTPNSKLGDSPSKKDSNMDRNSSPKKSNLKADEDIKGSFTLGFIDRKQWKALKVLTNDNTLVHVVFVFEKPLIPLTTIENIALPTTIAKGEIIPFSPTVKDLDIFFSYWMNWISTFRLDSNNCEARSLSIISYDDIPYHTTIQDNKTGIKIHQTVIGNFCFNDYEKNPNDNGISKKYSTLKPLLQNDSITKSGKFGSLRYYHQLSDQDFLQTSPIGLESNRKKFLLLQESKENIKKILENENKNSEDKEVDSSGGNAGFAKLRLWLDSSNPIGVWSNISIDMMKKIIFEESSDGDESSLDRGNNSGRGDSNIPQSIGADEKVNNNKSIASNQNQDQPPQPIEGIIICGPIVGCPRLLNDNIEEIRVPVLIEVDRYLPILRLKVQSLFSSESFELKFEDIPGKTPFILDIKTLRPFERYYVYFLSGVKVCSDNEFVITTNIEFNESNLVFLNINNNNLSKEPEVQSSPTENLETIKPIKPTSSIILNELTRRCKIPFNGINYIFHFHFQPNYKKLVLQQQHNRILLEGLSHFKDTGIILPQLKTEINKIFVSYRSLFREIFGHPSYKTILTRSFNLFIPRVSDYFLPGNKGNERIDIFSNHNNEGRIIRTLRLLNLIQSRIFQSYVDQLNYPDLNVYRALYIVDENPNNKSNLEELMAANFLSPPSSPSNQQIFEDFVQKEGQILFNSPSIKFFWSNPNLNEVDAVLAQWKFGCKAAPVAFLPYVTLNKQIVIESLQENTSILEKKINLFSTSQPGDILSPANEFYSRISLIQFRIAIISGSVNMNLEDSLLNPLMETTQKITKFFADWKSQDPITRRYTFICPHRGLDSGSRKLTLIDADYQEVEEALSQAASSKNSINPSVKSTSPQKAGNRPNSGSNRETSIRKAGQYAFRASFIESVSLKPNLVRNFKSYVIYMLDSIYRSNEFDRRFQIAQKQNENKNKMAGSMRSKNTSSSAMMKSKRAQKKKEEEERKQKEQFKREIENMMKDQVADGFLFIHCQTQLIHWNRGKIIYGESTEESTEILNNLDRKEKNTDILLEPKEKAFTISEALADNKIKEEMTITLKEVISDQSKEISKAGETEESQVHIQPSQIPFRDINLSSMILEYYGDPLRPIYIQDRIDPNEIPTNLSQLSKLESSFDILQLPLWFIQCFPSFSLESHIFVHDDIYFLLHQNPKTNRLIEYFASPEFTTLITREYERSRLSELSRPPDLREIEITENNFDMIYFFLQELLENIWFQLVFSIELNPSSERKENKINIRDLLLPIYDEFVKSYSFNAFLMHEKIKPTEETLGSSNERNEIEEAFGLVDDNSFKEKDKRLMQAEIKIVLSSSSLFVKFIRSLVKYSMTMRLAYKVYHRNSSEKFKQPIPDEILKVKLKEEEEFNQRVLDAKHKSDEITIKAIDTILEKLGKKDNKVKFIKAESENKMAEEVKEVKLPPIIIPDIKILEPDLEDLDYEIENNVILSEMKKKSEEEERSKSVNELGNEELIKQIKQEENIAPTNNFTKPTDKTLEEEEQAFKEMTKEDLENLQKRRSQLLVDTVTSLVEIITEKELEEGVNLAVFQLIQENSKFIDPTILTEEELMQQSELHFVRVAMAKFEKRRLYGQRLAYFK